MATICGVTLAVAGQIPAMAYGVATGSGKVQTTVLAAKHLTVTGPKASGWDNGQVSVPVTAMIHNPNRFPVLPSPRA